jgi:hypothetical protein
MAKAFLCSYPRSGSSYLRFLIDKNTDFCIGTSHSNNNFDVKLTSTNTQKLKNKVIAWKTHHPQQFRNNSHGRRQKIETGNKFTLLILIRNPLDTLKSWSRLKKFQIGPGHIKNFCKDWNNFISYYENLQGNKKMFLTYEQLITFPERSVQEICKHFGIEMNKNFKNVTRQESIMRSNKGFIGTCKILDDISFFTKPQINQIQNLCDTHIKKYFPTLGNIKEE